MYNLTQIAVYLGVDRTAVNHWINNGKLTIITIEGSRYKYVTKEELERFKQDNPLYANIPTPSIMIMKLHRRRDEIKYQLRNAEFTTRSEEYYLIRELDTINRRLKTLEQMV